MPRVLVQGFDPVDFTIPMLPSGIPAGFVSVDTFPGATWVEKLANASGNVWVPAKGETWIDAAWTDTRRQLVTIAKAVTRLRFEPGTTLGLNPKTSRYWTSAMVNAGATNPLSVIQQTSGQLVEWSGLRIVQTDQGHEYQGASLFNIQQPDGLVDLVIEGGEGTGGANPRETFTLTINRGRGWRVRGRYTPFRPDGSNGSAVGITFQDSLNCIIEDGTVIGEFRASSVVFYRSIGCIIEGAEMTRATVQGSGFGSGCFLNLELTNACGMRRTKLRGGVKDSDVTASVAGDKGGITIAGTYYSFDDAMTYFDDVDGGVSWTGTKNGLIGVRYWGQDVTLPNPERIGPLYAPGGKYAGLGVTLANVEAKGYPRVAGKNQGYDSRPAGVIRTPTVRRNGQIVPAWTSAYGKTIVAPGGVLIGPAA